MKTITIAGRIGKDAELVDGRSAVVCRFSVAVDSRQGGEKMTTWFDVSIFGKRGEALQGYLRKGTSVCVVGDLSARIWGNGEPRIGLSVVASEITLLGGGSGAGGRSPESLSGGNYDRASRSNEEEEGYVPF